MGFPAGIEWVFLGAGCCGRRGFPVSPVGFAAGSEPNTPLQASAAPLLLSSSGALSASAPFSAPRWPRRLSLGVRHYECVPRHTHAHALFHVLKGKTMIKKMNYIAVLCVFASILCINSSKAEAVNVFGLPHAPLGSATIAVDNESLVVSNIGSGGGDGVLVGIPSNTVLWDAHFNELGNPESYVPGSFFQVTGIATINGIANQISSTARITDLGSQWALNFDFSPVSSSPLLAQYFFNGQVIFEEFITDPSRAQWLTGNGATDGGITSCIGKSIHDCTLVDIEVTFNKAGALLLTPSGHQLVIDGMDVLSTDLDVTFGGYSGASLTASGIPTFTVNSEDLVLQPVPEPSSLLLLCSGLAGLASARKRLKPA